jgi:hypothetical protein
MVSCVSQNHINALMHWALQALEAAMDTVGVAPSVRITLRQAFEDILRLYLGDEEAGR